MLQLQSNGRQKRHPYIKLPAYVFHEIIKLNGVKIHGNKIIVEESKMPPRTIYNNDTFIKSSNLSEPLPNTAPSKPANPITSNTHQAPTQNVVNSHSHAIMPKNKISRADSIPRGMKRKL